MTLISIHIAISRHVSGTTSAMRIAGWRRLVVCVPPVFLIALNGWRFIGLGSLMGYAEGFCQDLNRDMKWTLKMGWFAPKTGTNGSNYVTQTGVLAQQFDCSLTTSMILGRYEVWWLYVDLGNQ